MDIYYDLKQSQVNENSKIQNVFRYACAISDGEEVIVTGYYYHYPRSDGNERYNRSGWIEDLPNLLGERYGHGCSLYFNTNGQKVEDI